MTAAHRTTAASLSDAELRHDGHDLIAELWQAVDSAARGSREVREAVSTVLSSLLDEAGPQSPYAVTLRAVIDTLAASERAAA